MTDRLVVIVGGGPVAGRKAQGVIEAGAKRVRCVSLTFDPELPALVERVEAHYEPRHLDGAGLVFAATDVVAVNDAVVRDARARGALVNRADGDDEVVGDFTVPAVWRSGPFTIGVSAGANPALAALVRDGLAARWHPAWTVLADISGRMRPRLRAAATIEPAARRAVMRDIASEEAIDALNKGSVDGLLKWLSDRHPVLTTLPKDD